MKLVQYLKDNPKSKLSYLLSAVYNALSFNKIKIRGGQCAYHT